jgi:hypothetical protein
VVAGARIGNALSTMFNGPKSCFIISDSIIFVLREV